MDSGFCAGDKNTFKNSIINVNFTFEVSVK